MGLAAFNRMRAQQAEREKQKEEPVHYDDITTKELQAYLKQKNVDYSDAKDKKSTYDLYLATFERG